MDFAVDEPVAGDVFDTGVVDAFDAGAVAAGCPACVLGAFCWLSVLGALGALCALCAFCAATFDETVLALPEPLLTVEPALPDDVLADEVDAGFVVPVDDAGAALLAALALAAPGEASLPPPPPPQAASNTLAATALATVKDFDTENKRAV
ncbi:hypothetical protein [Caballeronia insecticola]|uniref:Uncharacterized protein n=1 Tax=Caballeronia insecticola TaxID=758793 RepID=R4WNC8_9BURK|nr:hypothetical protein [Caballeronia insecticola]BAN26143.1 hypothetical protein BRPE64_CCDS00600 [Caballeronia insecticola]